MHFLILASTNAATLARVHEKHVNDERDSELQAVKPDPIKQVFVHHLSLFSVAPERKLLMAAIGNVFVLMARCAVMLAQFLLVA